MADIVQFRKPKGHSCCVVCLDKEPAHLNDMIINNIRGSQSITSFTICDECLARMVSDIIKYVN